MQGPNSPSTIVDDATVGTVEWVNPDNAKASDNVYAVFTSGGTDISHYLKATNFGFSIPTGATINGILAEVEGKVGAFSYYVDGFAVKANVIKTPRFQQGIFTTTEAYIPYGSSSSLWGQAWTAADINDSGFGIAIDTNSGFGASIDHIRITVYYTAGGNAMTFTGNLNISGLGF